jgi:hypothetical protein
MSVPQDKTYVCNVVLCQENLSDWLDHVPEEAIP